MPDAEAARSSDIAAPPPDTSSGGRLGAAIRAMRDRPGAAHTVLSLAKLVGMSRSNFAEAFRSGFGRSPMEYLRKTRLDRAALLLRSSALPVKFVGASVGYGSRTAFAHVFRRAFGKSPVEFRAASAEEAEPDIHFVAQRLRGLSVEAQAVTWDVDLASGTVWWSEGTFAALGYETPARLISDVARFYERIDPKDRERVVESVSAACMNGALTWQDEFHFKKADGAYAKIANGCIILRDGRGAARRLVGVMQILLRPGVSSAGA